jgi:hypothetical protein
MHVGDWGTPIEMAILNRSNNKPLPLGGLTSSYFLFQPPVGTPFTKDAELVSPPGGTDGKLVYVIEEGVITEAGDWQIQGFITDDVGEWHTDIETFTVGENIIVPAE